MSTGSSQNNIIEQCKQLINEATPSTLREIIMLVNNKLLSNHHNPQKTGIQTLDELFKYIPDIFTNKSLDVSTGLPSDPLSHTNIEDPDSFMKDLKTELDSLGLDKRKAGPRKVTTQWIVSEKNSSRDLKSALPMDKFPHITKLCNLINDHDECQGVMNGCIVNCFISDSSRQRPHADDEVYIDQNSSICTFSIGSSRKFTIFEKKHDPAPLRSYVLQNKSLTIMQPGSQSITKHKVMPGIANSEIRYSISFRHIINNNDSTAATSDTVDNNDNTDVNGTDTISDVVCDIGPIKTSVIFGTSITKYLCERKLEGHRNPENVKVINCSVSGAKIPDISKQMDDFYSSGVCDVEKLEVKSVFISVGTNDLARLRERGVNHLYIPIENLLEKAKLYFGDADIYFQSVIPMPIKSNVIVDNLLSFNKLILKACRSQRCYYLDVFNNFLDKYGDFPKEDLFRIDRRLNCLDVHLNYRGLGVLASAYISKIRGKFNPIV